MTKKLQHNLHPVKNSAIRFSSGHAYSSLDIATFLQIIESCIGKANAAYKREQIKKLFTDYNWIEHHRDKRTHRKVLSESNIIEYEHEKLTAIYLTKMNYDVIFAPGGMFKRTDKKFDVFLLRDTIILKADLKNISTKNSSNIAKRIKEGSDQAPRIVANITSDVDKNILIDGLKSASRNNELLKEILLIYKGQFYKLPKSLVLSKEIYRILK
ncbi:MAG: hypothetical protein WCF67_15425 [Chitinophagaceae bacterium]